MQSYNFYESYLDYLDLSIFANDLFRIINYSNIISIKLKQNYFQREYNLYTIIIKYHDEGHLSDSITLRIHDIENREDIFLKLNRLSNDIISVR